MPSETPVTPIIGPLLALLRSRKVLTALLALLLSALAIYAHAPQEIIDRIGELGLAVIGAIMAEDVARYFFTRPVASKAAPATVNNIQTSQPIAVEPITLERNGAKWWWIELGDDGIWVNGDTGETAEGLPPDDDAPEDKTGG